MNFSTEMGVSKYQFCHLRLSIDFSSPMSCYQCKTALRIVKDRGYGFCREYVEKVRKSRGCMYDMKICCYGNTKYSVVVIALYFSAGHDLTPTKAVIQKLKSVSCFYGYVLYAV